jgi:TatD family-associated radical SAM protein
VFCLRQNSPGVFGTDSLWLEREPTVEEIVESIESRNLDEFTEIVFCGYGEPTERLDDLLEVARHVKIHHPGMLVRINTNGLSDLIHGKPTAAKLKGLVDTVSISLNTPDPDEYFKMCRPKFGIGSWQAMLDFAKACTESVPDVVMTIVGSPVTTPEVQAKCKEITDGLGVRLRIRPYETSGDGEPPPGR